MSRRLAPVSARLGIAAVLAVLVVYPVARLGWESAHQGGHRSASAYPAGLSSAATRPAAAAPVGAFRDVPLPALLPAIAAAAGLVFGASASDFGVPAVAGLPAGYGTLTTRIYSFLSFSSSASSFTRAIALSALLGGG